MKTVKLFMIIALMTGISAGISAQKTEKTSGPATETFKVYGECSMCKSRIEKSAKEEGVASVSWNVKTKMVTVTFDPSITSLDALSKKFASVGHDTEKYKADDKVYAALPECCHYDRGAK